MGPARAPAPVGLKVGDGIAFEQGRDSLWVCRQKVGIRGNGVKDITALDSPGDGAGRQLDICSAVAVSRL